MDGEQAKVSKMIPPLPIIKDFIGNATEVQLIKEAISSEEYASSPNFCSQIGVICSYVRTDKIRISYSRIGAMFGKSKQCINDMHKNYIRGIGQEGRPPFLNNEELNQLKEYIYKLHTSEPFPIYPAIEEISSFIIDNFGKYLRHDTIRKMISTKFIDDFKSCIGVAMETKRMEATIIDIENNLKELKEKIELVPFPFIFNLDEKGEQQYADAFEKSVIVPASYEFITAPYAVSRTGKRASVLTCISPNGLMCQPQYAVPRLTVDGEIFHYIPSCSIQIVHTKNGFINTKSFIFWFKTCFLEKLKDLRLFHNYFGPAVLILDGYKSHEIALNSLNLEQYNIVAHYLVPHSSDQCQTLDIGIFGPMKRYNANYKNKPNISAQSNQILKIHYSLLCVCNEVNCHSAFRAICIISKSVTTQRPQVELAGFDVLKCKKIRAYEMSHINDLLNRNIPLTSNQQYIYTMKKNHINTDPNNFRISLISFENNQ